jgi:hypothetical protein
MPRSFAIARSGASWGVDGGSIGATAALATHHRHPLVGQELHLLFYLLGGVSAGFEPRREHDVVEATGFPDTQDLADDLVGRPDDRTRPPGRCPSRRIRERAASRRRSAPLAVVLTPFEFGSARKSASTRRGLSGFTESDRIPREHLDGRERSRWGRRAARSARSGVLWPRRAAAGAPKGSPACAAGDASPE